MAKQKARTSMEIHGLRQPRLPVSKHDAAILLPDKPTPVGICARRRPSSPPLFLPKNDDLALYKQWLGLNLRPSQGASPPSRISIKEKSARSHFQFKSALDCIRIYFGSCYQVYQSLTQYLYENLLIFHISVQCTFLALICKSQYLHVQPLNTYQCF